MIELVTIFIIMIAIFIGLFWLKKTLFLFGFFFKLFLLFLLACVVGSVLFGYGIVKDANNFKDNFGNSTSMVILKQTDINTSTVSFLAGLTFNPQSKDFKMMNKKEISTAQELYDKGNISELGKDYYKIFLIELKSFDDIPLYNITDQNVELTKEEIKSVLLSSDARTELAKIVSQKNGKNTNEVLKDLAATNEEVKGYLLSYYLTTVFNPSSIGELLTQLKSDNIKVYAETPLFKAIKLVPNSLIKVLVKV